MTCAVEIISIGNELLIGKTPSTNSQWLAKRITSLGGHTRRISIISDSLDEISQTLTDSLNRKPSLIITTGGLGPTFDDMTLKAIAATLKKPLNIDEKALEMVKAKYHQQEAVLGQRIELTPARIKMATLPADSKPLRNPIGTAPGVLLAVDASKIVALPGVPKEMEAIFEESVGPLVREMAGKTFVREESLKITEIMESAVAPLIDETMHDNPHVYIKSHPKTSESPPWIELHLMTTAESERVTEERIEAASIQISRLISEHGGKVDAQPSSAFGEPK